jgi:hypothetical protein
MPDFYHKAPTVTRAPIRRDAQRIIVGVANPGRTILTVTPRLKWYAHELGWYWRRQKAGYHRWQSYRDNIKHPYVPNASGEGTEHNRNRAPRSDDWPYRARIEWFEFY